MVINSRKNSPKPINKPLLISYLGMNGVLGLNALLHVELERKVESGFV